LGTGTEIKVFAQNAQSEKSLEEIVVTGSRIARRDYTSQSPIVTVDREAFNSRTSIGLEATLDQLPQFNMTGAGSAASNSAASTPFPQANVAPGAATVNLRGLGEPQPRTTGWTTRAASQWFAGCRPQHGPVCCHERSKSSRAAPRRSPLADAIGGVVNFILGKN
jgi:hypothetical protein